jgi:hypothetical protein
VKYSDRKLARSILVLALGASSLVLFVDCSPGFETSLSQSSTGAASALSEGYLAGKTLYEQNCVACHGPLPSSAKLGRTFSQISAAIKTIPQMAKFSNLSQAQIETIAMALSPSGPQVMRYVCGDATTRGITDNGLRRLTRDEILNTYTDLFGADFVAGLTSTSLIPTDVIRDSVSEFSKFHTRAHVDAVIALSLEVGQKIVENRTFLSRVAPACIGQGLDSGTVADSCVLQLVKDFGVKAIRRPLDTNRQQSYLQLFKDTSAMDLPSRVETLISALLAAPEAQYLWSNAPTPAFPGARAKVDSYTVASRLSYGIIGSMPDLELLQAAAQGTLLDSKVIQAHAARLIASSRGKQKVRGLFSYWLRLNKVPSPSALAISNLGLVNSGDTITDTIATVKNGVVAETLDYAEYIVFDLNGTFQDLMTSEAAFPRTDDVAKIFGTSVATTSPVVTKDGRQGLLMRPAVLMSSTERDSPIKRGVTLRTRILCDQVNPPPPSIDGEIKDAANSFDHKEFSSRDVAAKMTGSGTCMGCHSQLNPIGFALSSFGPLGEVRNVDRSFNTDGTVAHEFPINTSVFDANIITPDDALANQLDLANTVAQSEKARACLAAYAFRTSRIRIEDTTDDCQLYETEKSLSSGLSIKDALIKNATGEDILWKGF